MQDSCVRKEVIEIDERCSMSGPEGAVEHIPRLKRQEIQLTESEELSMGIC